MHAHVNMITGICCSDAFRRRRRFGLSGRRLGRSVTGVGSKPGRPPRLTQSASSASLRDALRRANSRADFDINNVVIPYGATAAASLIDRHEYKEIVTPKYVHLFNPLKCSGVRQLTFNSVQRQSPRKSEIKNVGYRRP